jgi:hypothetical protein
MMRLVFARATWGLRVLGAALLCAPEAAAQTANGLWIGGVAATTTQYGKALSCDRQTR